MRLFRITVNEFFFWFGKEKKKKVYSDPVGKIKNFLAGARRRKKRGWSFDF